MDEMNTAAIALGFSDGTACDSFIMAYKVKEPEFWGKVVSGVWQRPAPNVLTAKYEDADVSFSPKYLTAMYEMLNFAVENFTAAWALIYLGYELDDVKHLNGWTKSDGENGFGDDVVEIADLLCHYLDLRRTIDIDTSGEPI